jgi:predicted phage-related endonuclease
MKIEKLTEQEIQSIKDIQQLRSNLVEKYGLIELSIQDLELQKQEVNEELKDLKSNELTLSKELQAKYGIGTINIDSGEFIGNE